MGFKNRSESLGGISIAGSPLAASSIIRAGCLTSLDLSFLICVIEIVIVPTLALKAK